MIFLKVAKRGIFNPILQIRVLAKKLNIIYQMQDQYTKKSKSNNFSDFLKISDWRRTVLLQVLRGKTVYDFHRRPMIGSHMRSPVIGGSAVRKIKEAHL